jgi:hypothetical protein
MVPGEPESSYEFVIAMNARNAGRSPAIHDRTSGGRL